MFNFFTSIANFISTVVNYVISFFSSIIFVLIYTVRAFSYLIGILVILPSYLKVFVAAMLSLSMVLFVLNKGSD